jgi:adenylate kinase
VLTSASTDSEEVRVRASESGFDGVLFLQTPAEECIRRTQNRKTDPATGNIYHMDDSPPPEDPKLREKLVDFVDESQPE